MLGGVWRGGIWRFCEGGGGWGVFGVSWFAGRERMDGLLIVR